MFRASILLRWLPTPLLLHSFEHDHTAPLNPNSGRAEVLKGTNAFLSRVRPPQCNMDNLPPLLRGRIKLLNQRYIKEDVRREKRYILCRRCGQLSVMIGFDKTPSARLGCYSQCVGGSDYSNHDFYSVTAAEYEQMRSMSDEERITWFLFDNNTIRR